MNTENYLIELFCSVSQLYDTRSFEFMQRISNNSKPDFSDAEAITILFFWLKQGVGELKQMHSLTKCFLSDWFPKLPNYQNFVRRIAFLAPCIEFLLTDKITQEYLPDCREFVLDSMPIIVAKGCRSKKAKTALEICSKGYCSSKETYYYGIKLHCFAQKRGKKLPKLQVAWVSAASANDLTSAKENLSVPENSITYTDKAYIDSVWSEELKARNSKIITPKKLKKGQKELSFFDKLFNRMVSSVRQGIEQLFSWLETKTRIGNASKVRSTDGLRSFIAARLAMLYF